jgi:hypothetical protein
MTSIKHTENLRFWRGWIEEREMNIMGKKDTLLPQIMKHRLFSLKLPNQIKYKLGTNHETR